jgi:DNA invertase Pin-like site-specific DNA recombinase
VEGNGRRPERCAIYTRQSSAGRGGGTAPTSCAIQYDQCVELVRARGWEPIFERFDDWGLSGANLDRPAFKRLLRRIEEGGIDRVVAWRLDRVSRSMRDWIEFDETLRARGIGFTVGDGLIDRTGSTLGSSR